MLKMLTPLNGWPRTRKNRKFGPIADARNSGGSKTRATGEGIPAEEELGERGLWKRNDKSERTR